MPRTKLQDSLEGRVDIPGLMCAFDLPAYVHSSFMELVEDEHHKNLVKGLEEDNRYQKANRINAIISKRKKDIAGVIIEDFLSDIETLQPPLPQKKSKQEWYSYTITHPMFKSVVVDGEHRDLYMNVCRSYYRKFVPFGDGLMLEEPVKDIDWVRKSSKKEQLQVEVLESAIAAVEEVSLKYQLTIHDVWAQAIERYVLVKQDKSSNQEQEKIDNSNLERIRHFESRLAEQKQIKRIMEGKQA